MTSSTERTRRSAAAGIALLLLAVVLSGCAGLRGGEPAVSPQERAAYDAAEAQLATDRQAGKAMLREFLAQWPHSPLADDAAYRLGTLAEEEGAPDEALRRFYYVLRNYGSSDLANPARLRAAELELARGGDAAAVRLLAELDADRLSPENRLRAYRLRARLTSDPVARLGWLAEIRERTVREPGDDPDVDAQIAALLAELSAEDFSRALDAYARRKAIGGPIHLEMASRAVGNGEMETAERALETADDFSLTPLEQRQLERIKRRMGVMALASDRADLPTFLEAMRNDRLRTEGAQGTIGVVLPLSGAFAPYGQESLRGILLAADIFEPASGGDAPGDAAAPDPAAVVPAREPGVRILVRDSGGEASRAAAAVRDLARRDDVVAVIGPLLAAECEAAAKAAEIEGIPLLTLTSRQEIPLEREQVFRVRTTPADEVRYLVDYAVDELAATRFAILYPRDAYGLGMREEFWQSVESRGGFVTGVGSYDPEAVDFADPIRQMIGYVLLTDAEREAIRQRDQLLQRGRRLEPEVAAVVRQLAYSILGPEGAPLPPQVDFDALFIPDAHEKIGLIAPQLVFHELDGVQLLGPNGWNHPDLVRIARNHVRGAVIATPFHRESPFPFVVDFVGHYEATYQMPPDTWSAHAFDAAQLVLAQLASGRSSREALRDGVLRVNGHAGVSGVVTMLPDGNARKRPYLLRVRGGRLVPLDTTR